MRRARDEAHVALAAVAARLVILADAHEPGVLAGGAGVGLQRDGIEARDVNEPLAELLQHGLVPRHLVQRHKGVDVVDLGPRDGDHLGGGVELHGARAERDDGRVEPEVLRLQLEHVPHHLRLRVVPQEHLLGHVRRSTRQRPFETRRHAAGQLLHGGGLALGVLAKGGQHRLHIRVRRRFVERHRDGVGRQLPQVVAVLHRRLEHRRRVRHLHLDRVEVGVRRHSKPLRLEAGRERLGQAVDAQSDLLQAAGAVVDRVHGSGVGQQRLRGADVAIGLLPARTGGVTKKSEQRIEVDREPTASSGCPTISV